MVRPLEALAVEVRASRKNSSPRFASQLVTAARRTAAIKAQYGNTAAEDDLLKRMLRDRLVNKQLSRFA